MKQSKSLCVVLTALVLVLTGRELQRTFFPSSIVPPYGLSITELADTLDLDVWSFTLPQEIKSENSSRVTINWYRYDGLGDEEGELINSAGYYHLKKEDAGEDVRLIVRKTEKDTYMVWLRGPSWIKSNSMKNPYTDRELVGWSTDPSAGWGEDLYRFSSNPSDDSGQAPEYWGLKASFEEGTPEQDAEFETMLEGAFEDD